MNNRLSHSQMNLYYQCGEAYRLSYKEGYKPVEVSSALIFGSALGKAFEYILNKEAIPDSFKGKEVTPKEVFDYYWLYQEINGTLINLSEYEYIAWSKYDLDKDLGNDAYECMRTKGHLMIDTFINEFLPLVTKVWSTEEKIELANDKGDTSIGYSDAVVSLVGYDKPVIVDFKTAARPYERDSARNSIQLSQYLHVLSDKYNTRNVGYIVFLKNINKNKKKVCSSCGYNGTGSKVRTCDNEIVSSITPTNVKAVRCNGDWIETVFPKAEMQIIIDQIPEKFENMVIDNISSINEAIKQNIYVKNLNNCKDNGWGRPCQYYDLCHNNSLKGLVNVNKK